MSLPTPGTAQAVLSRTHSKPATRGIPRAERTETKGRRAGVSLDREEGEPHAERRRARGALDPSPGGGGGRAARAPGSRSRDSGWKEAGPGPSPSAPRATAHCGAKGQAGGPGGALGRERAAGPAGDTAPSALTSYPSPALLLHPGNGAHTPMTLTRSSSPPVRSSPTPGKPPLRGGEEGVAEEGRGQPGEASGTAAAAIPRLE